MRPFFIFNRRERRGRRAAQLQQLEADSRGRLQVESCRLTPHPRRQLQVENCNLKLPGRRQKDGGSKIEAEENWRKLVNDLCFSKVDKLRLFAFEFF